MKVKIPNKCTVGGTEFLVVWSKRYLEKLDLLGSIARKDRMIRLQRNTISGEEWVTLIHEVVHGIACENELEFRESETVVATLATGLCIFLKSIGIELDLSQIKEEKMSIGEDK